MNSRYRCPSCQQRNRTFSLYIDTETGEHIHPTVGRCNRESNCSYHLTPKQYFERNGINEGKAKRYAHARARTVISKQPPLKPISYIPFELFEKSLQREKNVLQVAQGNNFLKFLINLFGVEIADHLRKTYFIGTSKHWNGANVFWQIDTMGKFRTGKIMLYSPTTGKRVKEPFNHISWVHNRLKQPEFGLKQCLFGEHLLIDKCKPVAIVESEKTAIISSIYLPQFIWLAFGGIGFNIDKCSILKGRTVTLFPDLSKPKEGQLTAFEKWSNKAKELSHLAIFTVSDLLERKATEAERKQGLDLADLLIKFDYKEFVLPEPIAIEPPPAVQPLVKVKMFEQSEPVYYFTKPKQPKPDSWSEDITELQNYFASIELPTQPVKLNQCSTITNVQLFIESHFAIVEANNGNKAYLQSLHRLQELKSKLVRL
jgi:hypothetical protein